MSGLLRQLFTNPKLLTNQHIDTYNTSDVYKYNIIHLKIKSKLSRIEHPQTQNNTYVAFINLLKE